LCGKLAALCPADGVDVMSCEIEGRLIVSEHGLKLKKTQVSNEKRVISESERVRDGEREE